MSYNLGVTGLFFPRHCEERSNPGANQDSGLLRRLAMTMLVFPSLRACEAIQFAYSNKTDSNMAHKV